MARDCICDATGILGRKQNRNLQPKTISREIKCHDIWLYYVLSWHSSSSIDIFRLFLPCLLPHFLNFASIFLSSSSRQYFSPISLPFVFSSICAEFSPIRLCQCEIVHLPMIYCVTPYMARSVKLYLFSIIKRYPLNTRTRVPSEFNVSSSDLI